MNFIEKIRKSLIVRIFLAVTIGLTLGVWVNETVMQVVVTIQHILGQIIFFTVPLIIVGFVAPAITKLRANAGKMLFTFLLLAYLSSIGAAFFSMFSGYAIIPQLSIFPIDDAIKKLPKLLFKLDIPQVFPVMTALVLSIFLGLSALWVKAERVIHYLEEFNQMIYQIVQKIIVPILPYFIACTFTALAYEGEIIDRLPVFLSVIGIVILGHFLWLTFLYTIAALVSGKNPLPLIKNYIPAYLTAVGTMSSAATLPVALASVRKAKILREDILNFGIPLGATTHLCGSVLTEVFFVMVVSEILYGGLPAFGDMLLFVFLLGIFAIGAPGVPGGTVVASLGLITTVLGFDASGTALMLTIFALQDSFGTACNVMGDGALSLILQGMYDKKWNFLKE